jgi:phosphoglycerol geranylgeranyltransferase
VRYSFSHTNTKQLAVLIDPDKVSDGFLELLSSSSCVDVILVGGSLLHKGSLTECIQKVRSKTHLPIYIFPGNHVQIDSQADGILLLSLISGRNAEFLIGQHVIAAPTLKASGLDIVSTGYILVDCGKPTTASYISNTTPIPYNKPEITACTALAGEQLGLKIIYLDGGSGAEKPISTETIKATKSLCDNFMVVGGGIKTSEEVNMAWNAGANLVVVGTALENNPEFLLELCTLKQA